MYRVKEYETNDIDTLCEVIETYPFATVVSMCVGQPHVNHLPITAELAPNGMVRLIGHMSRHNPQWKQDQRNVAEALGSRPDEASRLLQKWMSKNL